MNTTIRIGNTPLLTYHTYGPPANYTFYTSVPAEYRQFYEHYVKEWFKWYDGYVDWFHDFNGDHGIFSTKLAKSIAHKFSKQITGGKLLFEAEKGYEKDKRTLSKVLKEDNFDSKLQKGVEWALAGGDSALKFDIFKSGKPTFTTVRKDEYFADVGFDGKINKFSCLIYSQTEQVPTANGENQDKNLFVMEERAYGQIDSQGNLIPAGKRDVEEDYPIYRLSIKRGYGGSVKYRKGDFHSADEPFLDLTKGKRDQLKQEFPDTQFNQWSRLHLPTIGVFLLRASDGVSFMPSMGGGESIFHNAIHILMSYDFYYSAKMTDLYLGRGKVLTPRSLESPHENSTYYNTLSGLQYEKVPYTNPEDQKPIPIQFDLRSQDWTQIRNDLLQELSATLNLSPRTVASYAVPSAEKPTAHEINVDQDDTALTVEHMREINEGAINDAIDTLCNYLDIEEETIRVKFSKMGLTNMSTMVNQMSVLKQNGMIDNRTALEYVFPDKTDQQIDDILKNMEKEKEQANNNTPEPNEDEMKDRDKDLYNNQVTHTPKPNENSETEDEE